MLVVAEHVVAPELVDADEPPAVPVAVAELGPGEPVPEKGAFAEGSWCLVVQEAWAL